LKRIVLMVVGTLLALAVAAPMVLAQPNGGAPGDASGTIFIKANDPRYPGACGFPFSLEFSGKAKTIKLPNGGTIATSPGLDVTVTNLEQPENQATFNITGTVLTRTAAQNGDVETVLRGRNFAIDPEAGTVVAIGRFSFVFDAEGNLVQPLSGNGRLIDICELLS
jgi:hypothetical protein